MREYLKAEPMDPRVKISTLTPAMFVAALDEHAALLHHCVEAGAPVGFVWPFSRDDARDYFESLVPAVTSGKRMMMIAEAESRVVGSMQLDLDMPPSQSHRGGARKLLVHSSLRNHGVGTALMHVMEAEARKAGRTFIDFTALAGGGPERLYLSIGYELAGVLPNSDHFPDGTLCDASILYKHLV